MSIWILRLPSRSGRRTGRCAVIGRPGLLSLNVIRVSMAPFVLVLSSLAFPQDFSWAPSPPGLLSFFVEPRSFVATTREASLHSNILKIGLYANSIRVDNKWTGA